MTLAEAFQRWMSGEQAAGRHLISKLYPPLYWFFRTKVDPSAVEDLTQSTFLVFFQKARQSPQKLNVRPFLFGIAKKKLLAHYRTSSQVAHRFEPLEHSVIDAAEARSITSAMGARDDLVRLYLALRKFPLDTRVLIELRYYDRWTESELAQFFGISIEAVRMRASRARQKLRDELARGRRSTREQPDEDELFAYFRELRQRLAVPVVPVDGNKLQRQK